MLTKNLPCERGLKIYLSICGPSHATEDKTCISTNVEQAPPMPARTLVVSQYVWTKSIQCQLGRKMHLNLCRRKPSHAWEDSKFISAYVAQSPPMPPRTKHASQHVWNKLPLWQRRHKIHLNMYWAPPPHASEDTIYFSTSHTGEEIKNMSKCVDQTLPLAGRTQHLS